MALKMIGRSCVAFGGLALSLIAVAADQAATISNIELVEGEAVIEVTGSGFGKGPKVVFFDDFQAADDGARLGEADIRIGTFNATRPAIYTTYDGISGEKGLLIRERNADGTSNLLQTEVVFDPTGEALFHYAVHVPSGNTWPYVTNGNTASFGDTSSWKFIWLMSGSKGSSESGIFDTCLPTHVGQGLMSLAGNDGGFSADKFINWWDWHGVNHITVAIEKSKVATENNVGSIYWRTINQAFKRREKTYSEVALQKAGVDVNFDRVKIPGWVRQDPNDGFNAIYDNIYVAVGENSKARIEVTDRKDPAEATFVIVIPPISWADDKVAFRVPAVIAGAREEFFVRIYNAAGTPSTSPARICLNCPLPPVLSN